MEPIAMLATGIIVLIMNYIILSYIIRKSSQSDESIRLQQIQIRLLSKLLSEKGVTNEELEYIVTV